MQHAVVVVNGSALLNPTSSVHSRERKKLHSESRFNPPWTWSTRVKGLFTANRTPPYFTRPLHSTPPLISKKKGLFSSFMLRGWTIAYKARQERHVSPTSEEICKPHSQRERGSPWRWTSQATCQSSLLGGAEVGVGVGWEVRRHSFTWFLRRLKWKGGHYFPVRLRLEEIDAFPVIWSVCSRKLLRIIRFWNLYCPGLPRVPRKAIKLSLDC